MVEVFDKFFQACFQWKGCTVVFQDVHPWLENYCNKTGLDWARPIDAYWKFLVPTMALDGDSGDSRIAKKCQLKWHHFVGAESKTFSMGGITLSPFFLHTQWQFLKKKAPPPSVKETSASATKIQLQCKKTTTSETLTSNKLTHNWRQQFFKERETARLGPIAVYWLQLIAIWR